jgi:hypothetical protein
MLGYRCFRCHPDVERPPVIYVPSARTREDVERALRVHGRQHHGDPGGFRGTWAATGTRIEEPYPCRCSERDPEWTRCGRACPCNGRDDIEIVPADCCARVALGKRLREARSPSLSPVSSSSSDGLDDASWPVEPPLWELPDAA